MGPNVATSLKNLEAVKMEQLTTRPTKPTKAQAEADPTALAECELDHDDCKEERKQAIKENKQLTLGLRQACFVIKGQCTPAIVQKLEGNKECQDIDDKQDAIGVLKSINDVNLKIKRFALLKMSLQL